MHDNDRQNIRLMLDKFGLRCFVNDVAEVVRDIADGLGENETWKGISAEDLYTAANNLEQGLY